MRQALGWIAVVVLCCAASTAAGEEKPDARLQEAQTAYDEATALNKAGKYAEALARGERALVLREAVLGGTHLEVASCLALLGEVYQQQKNFDQAEPLLQRGLTIREAALGKDHPDVAQLLNSLANLYRDQGKYAQAEPLYQRARSIREAALGKNHPDVAQTLNSLATLYRAQAKYAQAESLYQRGLAIREAALGKSHPSVAASLNNLALIYVDQGMYGRAEPLYQRALAIMEEALGKNHPAVASALNNLAELYRLQGRYGEAALLQERSLTIREAALGKDHPDVANSLTNLANLLLRQGLFSRAEPLYQRALTIREAALGKDHPDVGTSLNNLANLYREQGRYSQAEPLYERALAIKEAALGKDHPSLASSLHGFAILYAEQGMYGRAEPLFLRALAIREAALGPNHTEVADSLYDIAGLYKAQGMYDRAEPLYQRSLSIEEAVRSKNHPEIAKALTGLADLYKEQGRYGQARSLYERALAIFDAIPGQNPSEAFTSPLVATALTGLADLYQEQGMYSRAEPLHQRALALEETVLGKNHPDVVNSLNRIALLRLAQNRLGAAVALFTRAFAVSEQRLRHEALDLSEVRLASFLQLLRADEERVYALLRAHPDDAEVRRLALGAALLLKGRSLEETAGISRAVYRSLGPEERGTFERLRGLRTQLARLSFQGTGSLTPVAYQQQLKELAEQGDALEAGLARSSAPLRALAALPPLDEIVGRVAKALPKDGALIEFITYMDRSLLPKPGTPQEQLQGRLRCLALVLLPDGTIRVRDLGDAEAMDVAATRLRDALASQDFAFQAHAQALYRLAFQPLLPLLGKTRRLFLSPDGQLALVPFAALHDGSRFLVETFDFSYLTSGKDLLPRVQETAPAASVVVLADPDFSHSLQAPASALAEASAPGQRSAAVERFFSTLSADLSERAWTTHPLPGTRREAEAIHRVFPQAQLFLGLEATKERLLHLPPPGILHLATHGFFLKDGSAPPHSRAPGNMALGGTPLASGLPDPLLRSGLLFAGASARPTPTSRAPQVPPDSAMATALELAGLDLWGTQLVVLSACDTGRGDVKLGQGVYGLRRAFVAAGAETVVMSLWKVDDETTSTLMEAYYTQLLAGKGRAAALREAMRLLRATKSHPYYWAPFIALGQDAPLRALGPGPQERPKQ